MHKMAAIAAMSLFASQMSMAAPMAPQDPDARPDIEQVVSVDVDDLWSCDIRTTTMVYEDRQGQRHTLRYRMAGVGCGS